MDRGLCVAEDRLCSGVGLLLSFMMCSSSPVPSASSRLGRAIAFENGLLCADDFQPLMLMAQHRGVALETVLRDHFGFTMIDAIRLVNHLTDLGGGSV